MPTPQVSFLYSSGHLAGGKHGKLAIHSSSQLPDAMQYMDEASSYTADLARRLGGWGGCHSQGKHQKTLFREDHTSMWGINVGADMSLSSFQCQ